MFGVHVFPFNGTPQDLQTTASPTFAGLTLSDEVNSNTVFSALTLNHTTSGVTELPGIGTGMDFLCETASSENQIAMQLQAVATNTSFGTESFDFVMTLRANGSAAAEKARLTDDSNYLLGGTAVAASATNTLHLYNGTAPTGSITNGVLVYSEDVSASAELKARDEAGNTPTLSPHNFSMFTPDPADPYPWSYYSKNDYLGEEINVDMSGALRELEALSGKTFIHRRQIAKTDWRKDREAQGAQDRERQVLAAMNDEVEINLRGATEVAEGRVEAESTEDYFALNPDSGKVEKRQRKVRVERATGKMATRLKPGVRIDEQTGKLYRKKTREEAEAEIELVPIKPLPAWMAARLR